MHSTDPGPGTVYLIHLDIPYKHARHYLGWTTDLDARLRAHRDGHGARLMQVITAAGITWRLARTWPGGRDRERAIKDRHEAPRLCPACTPKPRPVSTGRAALRAVTAPLVLIQPPPPPPADPYVRGLRMAGQFLSQRAGCTAGQIIAAYLYVTGPFRAKTHHTAAEQEWLRGYTEPIARHLTYDRPGQAMPPSAATALTCHDINAVRLILRDIGDAHHDAPEGEPMPASALSMISGRQMPQHRDRTAGKQR
jgi:predicted GIY-YIG superfamily endonuclease